MEPDFERIFVLCESKLGTKEVDAVAFCVRYDGGIFDDWRSSGNGAFESGEKLVLGELCLRDVGMARVWKELYVLDPREEKNRYVRP